MMAGKSLAEIMTENSLRWYVENGKLLIEKIKINSNLIDTFFKIKSRFDYEMQEIYDEICDTIGFEYNLMLMDLALPLEDQCYLKFYRRLHLDYTLSKIKEAFANV